MTPIPEPDTIVIRTDDGIIKAEVAEVTAQPRPGHGDRLGGTLDADDPRVHYIDYWRADNIAVEE